MKNIFQKLKAFYQSKRGKSICFFGFYLIFFLVLAIILNNNQNRLNNQKNNKEEVNNQQINNNYNISNLINSNYNYQFLVYDNDITYKFSGSKNNIDYMDFDNKYFFDLYNINQLIKKSKFVKREQNILMYELNNSVLNDLLIQERRDGINKINIYLKTNGDIEKFIFDLSQFMQKDKYILELNYKVGDHFE